MIEFKIDFPYMRTMRPLFLAFLLIMLFSGVAPHLRADLPAYLAQPDSSYRWELLGETKLTDATLYELRLHSQTWQGVQWQHNLYIVTPANPSPAGAALLLIDGGSQGSLDKKPGTATLLYSTMLAQSVGVPCVILKQVPNQPLMEGRREDALIAHTLHRFLETKDATWPLLFPMTKAAVRAMDAVGEFSEQKLGGRIDKFVVTGASKRGWTTWLTAGSDSRVVALAPMVIDILNTEAQMKHQKTALSGGWSAATKDYHALLSLPPSEERSNLFRMIDPYSLREKTTQPKLIVLGNNDPFWASDALNLYWDGLKGDKWIHYVPNAGHNLVQLGDGPKMPPYAAIGAIAAFVRAELNGKTFPKITWKHEDTPEGNARLSVVSSPAPKEASLWVAASPTHDFREAKWEKRPVSQEGEAILGLVDRPATGSIAFYAALEYESNGGNGERYTLCTQLRIVDAVAVPAKSTGAERD